MSKNLYSIGEVAEIMGISVQTLRHYCDLHIIEPAYINPDTGYRYFSYPQFPYIDRTRYLLQCGLKLREIRDVLQKDDPDLLVDLLRQKELEKITELKASQDMLDRIRWYKDYFVQENRELPPSDGLTIQIRKLPERHLIAVPCAEGESYEDIHVHLQRVCHSAAYATLLFKRQFCTFLDYRQLINGSIVRQQVGMYIKNPPETSLEYAARLPAGDYLCFRSRILSSNWDPYPIQTIFRDRPTPAITIANEYENSFREYDQCVFEIQFLIS